MAGWFSPAGLGITDELERRVNSLRDFGVVSVLQGDCNPGDVSAALQWKTGDGGWSFQCSRVKDFEHFLVKCRSRRVLDGLCSTGAFEAGNALVKVGPWTLNWGCHRRLGSGDPRWIRVTGIPIQAWSVLILQEFFGMHGEVMDLQPSGALHHDHVVADVLFDALDWDALPDSIGKRLATGFHKIFIDKSGDGIPRSPRREDVLRLAGDASSANLDLLAPAGPNPTSSSRATPPIQGNQEDFVAENVLDVDQEMQA